MASSWSKLLPGGADSSGAPPGVLAKFLALETQPRVLQRAAQRHSGVGFPVPAP